MPQISACGSLIRAASRYLLWKVCVMPIVRQFLQVPGSAILPSSSDLPFSPAAKIIRKSGCSCTNLSTSRDITEYLLQDAGRVSLIEFAPVAVSGALQPHELRWIRAPALYGSKKRFLARSMGTVKSFTRSHAFPGSLQSGWAFC